MKFRKKPVVIEAFKWTGGPDQTEDPEWIVEAIKAGMVRFENSGTSNVVLLIDTLEGTHRANQGDFIIQGVKGELYPCKPDIFEATYEPVKGHGIGRRERRPQGPDTGDARCREGVMKKYRKAVYDPVHDIWALEERFLWFFWRGIGAGSEKKVDEVVARLNKGGKGEGRD